MNAALRQLKAGQTPTAADWNALVAALADMTATTGTAFGAVGISQGVRGAQVLDGREGSHWAKITARGTGNAYAHVAVSPDGDGTFTDLPQEADYFWGTTTAAPAREVNGRIDFDDSLPLYTQVWLDPQGEGWLFDAGGTGSGVTSITATDCRSSAGWDADTCLTWAVPVEGRGRCASVPVQTATPLTWDSDAGWTGVGGWVGVSPLATDIGAAEVRIWREKGELVGKAVIDSTDYWLTRTGCRSGKVVFVGGRELCTEGGEEVSTTCGDHTFEVEVGCDVCGDAEGVVAECCPGVFIPSELCMAFDFAGTDAPGFLSYASVDGPTAVTLKGSYTARLVGMAGFTDDGFTGLGWVAVVPIAGNAVIDGYAVGVWCNGGEWHARARYTYGGTATATYNSMPDEWITADCDPFSVGIAVPDGGADPTFTFAAVPAEGCGTGTGTAPTGSDAGGDYGGLCDAVLGPGGPLDPGALDVSYATAASAYGPKFSAAWDAATTTQDYGSPNSPLTFFPATPGDPPVRMVFYVRDGVAYMGVWEAGLPPTPFDPTDADYTAAADATPVCGSACFKAVFTDATLLTYAPAVTGGEIVVETAGGCVPDPCTGAEYTVDGTVVLTGSDPIWTGGGYDLNQLTPTNWLLTTADPLGCFYNATGWDGTGSQVFTRNDVFSDPSCPATATVECTG